MMRIIRRPGQPPIVVHEPLLAAVETSDDDDDDRPSGLVAVACLRDPTSLAIEGGLPPDEMHVTLGYFGAANDVGGDSIESLREWVDDQDFESITARVSGVGRIGDDDPPATVLLLEAPELNDLRSSLSSVMQPDMTHPHFTPHVTLGYGVDMPDEFPREVQLSHVELWIAGEHYPAREDGDAVVEEE